MHSEELRERINAGELKFSTSRSSGPGGQNVNKVNTKVELRFDVNESPSLSASEKELIITILRNRINNEGELLIISQSERTQLQNKQKAEDIFYNLVAKALIPKKPRKATRPTLASKAKRLEVKKRRSAIKSLRKESGGFEE
jgi:ribosome-associated protein